MPNTWGYGNGTIATWGYANGQTAVLYDIDSEEIGAKYPAVEMTDRYHIVEMTDRYHIVELE